MNDRPRMPLGARVPRWATHVAQYHSVEGGWFNVPCGSREDAEAVCGEIIERGLARTVSVLAVSRDPEWEDEEAERRDREYDDVTFERSVDGGPPHIR